jgi:hypothetical protein
MYWRDRVQLPISTKRYEITEHHAMKMYWGVEVYLLAFFDLGTRWR